MNRLTALFTANAQAGVITTVLGLLILLKPAGALLIGAGTLAEGLRSGDFSGGPDAFAAIKESWLALLTGAGLLVVPNAK